MVIYEPKGKAREYCARAVNIYRGCDHGCKYCYVPNILRMKREEFMKVQPRNNITALVEKEAPKISGQEVLLCFTCDPYSQKAAELGLTRGIIEILFNAGVIVNVLTKGGLRSLQDFDLMEKHKDQIRYGITLTCSDPELVKEWEPGAASNEERIACLKKVKSSGIKTWVSFEPVLNPEQVEGMFESIRPLADIIKVGKWNHDTASTEINWRKFAQKTAAAQERLGGAWYLKEDLRVFLETQ